MEEERREEEKIRREQASQTERNAGVSRPKQPSRIRGNRQEED
jgi:hypothetical protein